jgi:hypothetical protein
MVATRWREPMAERPTALEITAAQGVIARFAGFGQLAAIQLETALTALMRFRRAAPWPPIRIRLIWFA